MSPTQQELEQPVKGYQLKEVSDRLSDKLKEQDKKLDKLIEQTSNLVTFKDLDRAVQDRKDDTMVEVEKLKTMITTKDDATNKRIDNEVCGFKASNLKVFWAIILGVIAVVISEIGGYFKHG